VRRRTDFTRGYEQGGKAAGRVMTVFVQPNALPVARLGVAATRKIGDAVERNRAKRVVRELFRQHKPPAGVDVLVVPRREFLNASYPTLEREFRMLVDRARRSGAARSDRGRGPGGNQGV
jgi:ribonuclease P protein component